MFKFKKMLVVASLSFFGLSGCQTVNTTSGGAVGIERSQTMFISEENVQRDAKDAYNQLITGANQQGLLNPDPQQYQRVKFIADRIIQQVGSFRQDASKWHWEVNVIKSKQLNAACMAGGKIYIYTGIIDNLKLTDDEIGAIIGHEVAHALREHIREKVSKMMGQQLLIGVIAGASKNMNSQKYMALQIGSKLLLDLPNSREQEREADKIGLELSARAGFNPWAGVSVWEKMSKAGGGNSIEFLSTHPSSNSRIDEIKKIIPLVYPLYQNAMTTPIIQQPKNSKNQEKSGKSKTDRYREKFEKYNW